MPRLLPDQFKANKGGWGIPALEPRRHRESAYFLVTNDTWRVEVIRPKLHLEENSRREHRSPGISASPSCSSSTSVQRERKQQGDEAAAAGRASGSW